MTMELEHRFSRVGMRGWKQESETVIQRFTIGAMERRECGHPRLERTPDDPGNDMRNVRP